MIEGITAEQLITGAALVGIPVGFAYIIWRIRDSRKKQKKNPLR